MAAPSRRARYMTDDVIDQLFEDSDDDNLDLGDSDDSFDVV